jgi:hypothetical protein
MIDYTLFVAWLDAIPTTLDYRFRQGPREEEFGRADLVATVTPLPGPGLSLDGLGNQPSFQIKLTGRERQADDIRKTAFEIDTALLWGAYPFDAWGTYVQYVDRTGGEPSVLQEDEHDRVAYVCTYVAHETPEL